jgi:NitT/TauT family transport system substrate-binding protein
MTGYRRFKSVAVWLALMVAFALAPAAARADDHIIVQLAWLPSGENQAPYAGIAQGYFATEHIQVDVRRGAGGGDALDKVATGAAQYGITDLATVMAARGQGAPVKAIMALYVRAPHAVITRGDTGIKSFADLPGHTIGTAATASTNLFFPLILSDNHVDATTIKIINVDPSALGPMLLTKRVDGVLMWVTNLASLTGPAQQEHVDLVTLPFATGGMEMYSEVIIATEQQLKAQPDLTRRFLRALRLAYFFMRDHPRETAVYGQQANPQQDVEVETARTKIVNGLMFQPPNDGDRFGTFDPALLHKTYEWMVRAHQIDPSVNPEQYVDRSFLPPPGG